MFPVSFDTEGSRRSFFKVLILTTAAAALLGGCNKTGGTGLIGTNGMDLPTVDSASLSGAQSNRAKVGQWASAYARKPSDPRMVLGYAYALKATGNKQQALTVLNNGFRANPGNGEIAAQLGRVALELGRTDIAQKSLAVAQKKGVNDWRTLSAQGTLLAKKGDHANAQRYFQAALKQKPDSTSVINNLALSYALDGKAKESETLLRKAVASGATDKRVRQNLALVIGLQGKFNEATQVASVGADKKDANQNVAYLRKMLNKPTQMAAAEPEPVPEPPAQDYAPFGPHGQPSQASQPVHMAASSTLAGNAPARPAGRLPQSVQTASSQAAIEAERSQSSGSSVAQKRPVQAPSTVASRNIPIPAEVRRPVVAQRYEPSATQSTTVAKKITPARTAVAQAAPGQPAQSQGDAAAAASLLRSDLD
ncbi:tetratricopeptide repeat protein [Methyloligella solikamskensis]|uniref:Tetratricopeptide repeat protein n=1 Tax=Methyloligella solikamskensis TaxID=1177756 RepID=A0ABW3JCV3_9HYPH